MMVDEQSQLGGSLLSAPAVIGGQAGLDWAGEVEAELRALPEVTILSRSTVTGYYDHNYLTLLETTGNDNQTGSEYKTRQRLWKVRAKRVVLATGQIERPLIFRDNDRPGIMLSASMRAYLNRYGVSPGNRVLLLSLIHI